MNSIDLNGRRAIVTGGAQGLGRAIGERLQASGAAVYVWDFDPAAMSEAEADWPDGGPAGWIEVDVSDADAVEAALRETQASAGSIDILVNNAGISGPQHADLGVPGGRLAPGDRYRSQRPLPGVPRGGAADACGTLAGGASSTSPRWPARRATPTHPPIARPRVG